MNQCSLKPEGTSVVGFASNSSARVEDATTGLNVANFDILVVEYVRNLMGC